MSSAALDRGLLANCVASRLRVVDDREQRKLIWWLALASHEPEGLARVARMMIERWPERFVTATMQKLGCGKGRIYNTDEVRQVRINFYAYHAFPLRADNYEDWGSEGISALLGHKSREQTLREIREATRQADRDRQRRPTSYAASEFAVHCIAAADRDFGDFLFKQLCLNPAVEIGENTLWYLPDLLGALRDCHAAWIAEKAAACAVSTAVGTAVEETLSYGLTLRGAGQSIVVIDGLWRIGKTFAVKQWMARHPGEARYAQVPSSNDDMSFFRAIGDAVGIGGGRTAKAHELRDKIEDVLQRGDLMLVLDEGHYLWPQRNQRKAVPHRITWIMTQLANMGVPVAIVTTPQFTKSQEALAKHGGWSSEQFIGRIADYKLLPECLSESDLTAVVRAFLPKSDRDSINLVVAYARSSEKYLAGIESLARRAFFVANQAGRNYPTFIDVTLALEGGVVPSDKAMHDTLKASRPAIKARDSHRPHAPCSPPARPLKTLSEPSRAAGPVATYRTRPQSRITAPP